jgi:hypothetical protein
MTARKWNSGPPPFPGWWNADFLHSPRIWRWYDGRCWSYSVSNNKSAVVAAKVASRHDLYEVIEWTDYWPKRPRAEDQVFY